MKELYVDYKKANELEMEIKALENELTMATLNDRKDDARIAKSEIEILNQKLEELYWS